MTEDADPAFERIADDLYALRPEEFAAARDAQAKLARASKDGRALAQRLAALRRPVQGAWYLNLLSRQRQGEVDAFLTLGEALQQVQSAGDVPALQRLMGQRRTQEEALVRAVRALAAEAGSPVSAAQEREVRETLSAALALPELATELRRGRLLKPVAYAGFGPVVAVPTPTEPAPRGKPAAPLPPVQAEAASPRSPTPDLHQQQIAAARIAVTAAEQALDAAHAVRQAEEQRVADLKAEVTRLEGLLRDARSQLVAAEAASVRAQQEYDRATKACQRASDVLQKAARDGGR